MQVHAKIGASVPNHKTHTNNLYTSTLSICNITNKHKDLKQLAHTAQPEIITVQETKLP